jgi:hypothetical protein
VKHENPAEPAKSMRELAGIEPLRCIAGDAWVARKDQD